MYIYKAKYLTNYDGDTVRFDIDLGFGVFLKNQIIRLYGVNCPEIIGAEKEAAKKAKDFVASVLTDSEIRIQTYKDSKEKYGRWLAEIFYKKNGLNEVCLNSELLSLGLAVVMKD